MTDAPETFIQLLRKMGHDMRVPLNTLISTTDMLADGVYDPLTPKQAKAVVRLQRNNRRLLAMLDDFITFMKADAGELGLIQQSFDPRERLTEWCGVIRPTVEEKGLQLLIETAESVPAALTGDETVLNRVMAALLWNAVSHTEKGEIRVKSDWTPDPAVWLITVQDTGCGIPQADQPHIFEPFWRGEARPQVPTAGAGLGLPMARALTKLMGGTLELKSTSDQGSTFSIRLPE